MLAIKAVAAVSLLAVISCGILFQSVSARPSGDSGYNLLKYFPSESNKLLYDAVNEYLMRKDIKGDQPEQDIEEAINWLKSKANGKNWLDPRPFGATLKQLIDLKNLKGNLKCDNKESLSVVKINNKATRKQVHTNQLDASSTPIDKIVHHYLVQHAKGCLPVYRERFGSLVKNLDWRKVRELAVGDMNAKVLIATKKSNAFRWSGIDFESFRQNLDRVRNGYQTAKFIKIKRKPEPNSLLEALKYLSIEDPNTKFLYPKLINEAEIRTGFDQVLNSTILEPCKEFVETVAVEVMIPLNYEYPFIKDLMNDKSKFIEYLDLNVGLLANRLCRNIYLNRQDLYKSIKPLLLLDDGQHF